MKGYAVYSIMKLPLFTVETSDKLQFVLSEYPNLVIDSPLLDENIGIDETDDSGSDDETFDQNNKRNKLIGDLGEEIAKAYLLSKRFKIKQVSKEKGKSNAGYDVLANNHLCFEVKTSLSANYEFEISINELRVLNEKRDDYHIFYVMVDVKNKAAKGFIFANPIEEFNIDFENLIKQVSIFRPTSFKGTLREHINLAEPVDLTELLAAVLEKESKYTELFSK